VRRRGLKDLACIVARGRKEGGKERRREAEKNKHTRKEKHTRTETLAMAMDGLHPLVGTFLMLLFLVLPCLFVLLAGAQAAARSSMVNLVLHDNADAADAENFLIMKRTKESSVLGDLGMKSQKRMKESSVLGDPGMKSQKVRVAVEGWNFCNRVGEEDSPPQSPSPRWADCADLDCNLLSKGKNSALKSPTLA
jgi:hypothetical protein